MSQPYEGDSSTQNIAAIIGRNTAGGDGVFGSGTSGGRGVVGVSDSHIGVEGDSNTGIGVYGRSQGRGVEGHSNTDIGVAGFSQSSHGIYGETQTDIGVLGVALGAGGRGVVGVSNNATGTEGNSTTGTGVYGSSQQGIGVHGVGSHLAGFFEGNVEVTGNINVRGDIFLTSADCAEEFDLVESDLIEPGTVMVMNQVGMMQPSHQAYDKCVAGVISGAGDLKPGIILGKQPSQEKRMPIALLGKVYCKVDAQYSPIEVGDLLTTSPTLGHAMKADDPVKAFGSVIGKALHPLQAGQGMIPILIALQ